MLLSERFTPDELRALLGVGTAVAVRSSYRERWSPGFEVAAVRADDDGLLFDLRRRSDGSTLPVAFRAADLRPAD